MSKNKEEHEDYYIDAKGRWIFTAIYHEKRGYCCGEACKHCPFDYESVPEPIKTRALQLREVANKKAPSKEINTKDTKKHL